MLKHCYSMRWKEWGGYYAVSSYDHCHEREYNAFRQGVGAIDVSPLFKYQVSGPDAGAFLARIMSKDVRTLKQDQCTYLCWCDDEGWVMDDGTVTRLGENEYRVTAAEPTYHWFKRFERGYSVTIEDLTDQMGALAIQGPKARDLIRSMSDLPVDTLKFFRGAKGTVAGSGSGIDVYITRTGYTGDLGYELWVDRDKGNALWDRVMDAGKAFNIEPCGIDALDITRVEAGFIMNGVDYFSANHCMIDSRKSNPYEINLGWTIKLDRDPFIGQKALQRIHSQGPKWKTVGLVLNWNEIEKMCAEYDLPPNVSMSAWRANIPIYNLEGKWVGYSTSGTWSPILKKILVMATVESEYADLDQELKMEWTVEYRRRQVTAVVSPMPFYNPERKRSLPNVH